MEENKIVEIEENNNQSTSNFKSFLLENLTYLIIIAVGVISLIIAIIKKENLGLSECLIGLGVGQSQLHSYLKEKNKTTLACMILWFCVALVGLVTFIIA